MCSSPKIHDLSSPIKKTDDRKLTKTKLRCPFFSLRSADVFPVVASEGDKRRPGVRQRFAGYTSQRAIYEIHIC